MGRDNVIPVLGMVVVMVVFAGVNVLYKLAIEDGMSLRVLVAYRYLFATAFLGPLAFFVERGSLAQNLYVASLSLTSASLASAMTNIIPAITFVLAVTFRLELLAIRTVAGKAKVFGTLIVVGGAMLLSFYKGMEINLGKTSLDLSHHHHHHHESGSHALGSLLAVAYCISSAVWLIIQAQMIAKYMCLYSVTALMCLMASVQGVVFAFCVESDWGVWRLGFDIRLLTVVYTKGPLFTSIFNPVTLVIVAVLGSIFLNENLHLGSILGTILIVIGMYMVLWGKGNENKQREQLLPVNSPIQTISMIALSESPNSGISSRVLDEEMFAIEVVQMTIIFLGLEDHLGPPYAIHYIQFISTLSNHTSRDPPKETQCPTRGPQRRSTSEEPESIKGDPPEEEVQFHQRRPNCSDSEPIK
ncbi:WAT1-related protein [Acorus calamus]|uniref:WAT1-related protein n=1 Tax=Acorus calamus TaxID=4465 RepID=A0AAV9DIH3_ACOCL|nr:WAT1-related protein [Acorus calamus]